MSVSIKAKFTAAAKMATVTIERAHALVKEEFGNVCWTPPRTVRKRASMCLAELRAAMKAVRLAAKCAPHLAEPDPIPEAPPRPEKRARKS